VTNTIAAAHAIEAPRTRRPAFLVVITILPQPNQYVLDGSSARNGVVGHDLLWQAARHVDVGHRGGDHPGTGLAIDQRGFGESDQPASGYTVPELAGDLIAFLDAMAIPRAHLVGHSFGTLVSRQSRASRTISCGAA
jgi:hypothetical protein